MLFDTIKHADGDNHKIYINTTSCKNIEIFVDVVDVAYTIW